MVGVDDLALLFRGDKYTLGYAHPEIVVELCSRTAKGVVPSAEWCTTMLYGDTVPPQAVKDIIVQGVKLWYRRGRPRH